MKKLSLLVLFMLAACQSTSKQSQADMPKIAETATVYYLPDTTQNVAQIFLDIEKKEGFEVVAAQEILDTILSNCTTNNTKSPIEKLSQIHQYLQQNWFQKTATYSPLLCQSLQYKMMDCDLMSVLYCAIAQTQKFELKTLLTHQHAFVANYQQKDTLYWETLIGKTQKTSFYAQKYGINTPNIGKGNILKPLSKLEMIALAYLNIAQFHLLKSDYQNAAQLTYKAMHFAPNWCATYATLAQIFEAQQNYNQAESAYIFALELQPDNPVLKEILTNLYLKIGCQTEANKLQNIL